MLSTKKDPHSLARGSEGGLQNCTNVCSSLPSSCLWRDSRRRHLTSDLMSMRAGLLASRSSYWLRLPIDSDSGFTNEAFVARYSGLYRTGFAPDSLFSFGCRQRHSHGFTTIYGGRFKELPPYTVIACSLSTKDFFPERWLRTTVVNFHRRPVELLQFYFLGWAAV